MSDRTDGGLRRAFIASAVTHAALIVAMWVISTQQAVIPPMRVYSVNIVSPPPQEAGPPTAAEPEVAEEEPEPEPEPEPEEEPEPEPEPPPPPPPPPPPAPPERRPAPPPPPPPPAAPPPEAEPPRQAAAPRDPTPSRGDDPDPTSPGGDNLNLQLPGVQCPTPDYCNNIVRQIDRYFRAADMRGEADVYFVINRDGSIAELRLINSTGGASFRIAVLEAVEQAGRNRAFGPLPDAYQADQLPVRFDFRPNR